MQYNWPLIGHQPIKDYFAKAFSTGKIHHAYLFEGPEHLGKFTFAMMLAKTLLCEAGSEKQPCGKCRSCIAFDHGVHPDFLALSRQEDDTTISVEAMRGYISALHTKPLLGKRRIGIMEEAQLMVAAGSNALLKTLEEPPGDAVLFLISSRPVLPTIASRCQRIRFGFVASKDIEDKFSAISREAILSRLTSGRPGLAAALQEKSVAESYREKIAELSGIFSQDEGARLLWIAQRMTGRSTASQKRQECKEILEIVQAIARQGLYAPSGARPFPVALHAEILKRTLEAEKYLKSNVDPRLVCEYILLNHELGIRNHGIEVYRSFIHDS